ncbi:DUF2314 domain-containing protein [Yoonia sp. R2-816]
MMRAFVLALFLVAPAPTLAQGDPVVPFTKQDSVMNAAIAAAQASLPLFLCTVVNDEGYSTGTAYLKVAVPISNPDIENEIIWVGPFAAWTGTEFAGILANQPVDIPGYALGDQFDFTYDMIVDWSLLGEDGQRFGDYTTRVIYQQSDSDDAAAILAAMADPPYPPEWTCDD